MTDSPSGVGARDEVVAARAALQTAKPTPEILGAVHEGLQKVPDDGPFDEARTEGRTFSMLAVRRPDAP